MKKEQLIERYEIYPATGKIYHYIPLQNIFFQYKGHS